jgi:hypothetical protein
LFNFNTDEIEDWEQLPPANFSREFIIGQDENCILAVVSGPQSDESFVQSILSLTAASIPSNRLLYAAIPSHDEATDIFFCGEEVYFTPT